VRRHSGDFARPGGRLATVVEESLDELRREPDGRVAILRV
jgi:hypothetical protein